MFALLSVGMANADIDGKKFCVYIDPDTKEFHIAQRSFTVVGADEVIDGKGELEICVDRWGNRDDYTATVEPETPSVVSVYKRYDDIAKFVIDTDLDLGGYTTDALGNISCKEEFYPLIFAGATLEGKELTFTKISISNFCYINSLTGANANAAFYSSQDGDKVSRLQFSNAYVESKNGPAAVVNMMAQNATYESVSVLHSTVVGKAAAAVATSVTGSLILKSVEVGSSKIRATQTAGGMFGSVLNSGAEDFTLVESFSYVGNTDISVDGTACLGSAEGASVACYAGGIAAVFSGQGSLSSVTVNGGSISIGGSASEFDSYLGGFFGHAVVKKNASLNVSEGSVDVTLSGARNMGGFVGALNGGGAGSSDANLMNLSFYGKIEGSCSANPSIGGIVGKIATTADSSLAVSFKQNDISGSIGETYGTCTVNKETLEIPTTTSDFAYVGGLFGSCGGSANSIAVAGNLSTGSISVSVAESVEGLAMEGYIAGYCTEANFSYVVSNLHYNRYDDVVNAIGSGDAALLSNDKIQFKGNFRNATNKISATGTFDQWEGVIKTASGSVYNGVVADADMKSPAMAHALTQIETPVTYVDNRWSFRLGYSDDLPFFRAPSDSAIRLITFTIPKTATLSDAEKESLTAFNFVESDEGYSVRDFTDSDGLISKDLDDYLASLMDEVADVHSSQTWKCVSTAVIQNYGYRAPYKADLEYELSGAKTYQIKLFVRESDGSVNPVDESYTGSVKVFTVLGTSSYLETDLTAALPQILLYDGTDYKSFDYIGSIKADGAKRFVQKSGSFLYYIPQNADGVEGDEVQYSNAVEYSLHAIADYWKDFTNEDVDSIGLFYKVSEDNDESIKVYFDNSGEIDFTTGDTKVTPYAVDVQAGTLVSLGEYEYASVAASLSLPKAEKLGLTLPEIPEKFGYKTIGWEARMTLGGDEAKAILTNGVPQGDKESVEDAVNSMSRGLRYYYSTIVTNELDLKEFYSAVLRKGRGDIAIYLTPKYQAIKANFVFDYQTEDELFASYDWNPEKEYFMASADAALPVFYRVGYCLDGWKISKDDGEVYSSLDETMAHMLQELYPDASSYTLYASWSEKDATGAACGYKTVTATTDGHSTLALVEYSTSKSDSLVHLFTASGENTFELKIPGYTGETNSVFYIANTSEEGYVTKNVSYRYESKTDFYEYDGGELSAKLVVAEIKVENMSAGPYDVVLDFAPRVVGGTEGDDDFVKLDLDVSKMVFATSGKTNELSKEIKVQIGDYLPYIYSLEGYQLEAWVADLDNIDESEGMEYHFSMHTIRVDKGSSKLYSFWKALSSLSRYYQLSGSLKNGTVTFSQKLGDMPISVPLTDNYVLISEPANGTQYTFKLNVEPAEGYKLVGNVEIAYEVYWRNYSTNKVTVVSSADLFENGELVTLPAFEDLDEKFVEWVDVSVSAATAQIVNVALDVNSKVEKLFYGSDWKNDIEILADELLEDDVTLPEYVYGADACLLKWATEASDSKTTFVNGAANGDIWNALAEKKAPTLYGVWGNSESCVATDLYSLASVEVESEYAEVEFLEIPEGKDEKSAIHHALAEDNSILIPSTELTHFVVSAKSTSEDYELEEIVLTYKSIEGESKTVSLKDGDALPADMRSGRFAPAYVEVVPEEESSSSSSDGKSSSSSGGASSGSGDSSSSSSGGTSSGSGDSSNSESGDSSDSKSDDVIDADTIAVEFVVADVHTSGNAIKFNYEFSAYKASDSAEVLLILENEDGIVGDTVSLASGKDVAGFKSSWEKYPLKPGNYLLSVDLVDGDSSAHFEQDFEVVSTFAEVSAGGWTMVSLGYVDMDSVNWDDAYVYWWDESRNYGDYWQYQAFNAGNEPELEQGYWFSSEEGGALRLTGEPVAEAKGEWTLDSIYSGWNQVANPYGWYLDLCAEERCAAANEKSDVEFYRWNDSISDYEPVTVLKPYEAVWAKVSGPKTWKLSSKPEFVASLNEDGDAVVEPLSKAVVLAKAVSANNWNLQVSLADENGKKDSWNIVGVGPEAWNAEEPPEGMGDHVNLSIVEGSRGLAKSFKKAAAGNAYEWTMELSASTRRSGYLSVAGADELRAHGLKVYVTVDGETTELNDGKNVQVALSKSSKVATIRVAEGAVKAVAYRIEGLKAVQSSGKLQVSFAATEGLAGSSARVDLMDMKGHVLRSVSAKTLAGENQMALDLPKSGLYMLRVRAGSQVSAGKVMVK